MSLLDIYLMEKETSLNKQLHFFELRNQSKITCHGKPKRSDIAYLKKMYNINVIITILSDKEGAEEIHKYTEEEGEIKWIHLPIRGANMTCLKKEETIKMIIECLLELYEDMKKNKRIIYIHCAAGLHRTGIILYTLLRITGETKENALNIIKDIRLETYKYCGEHRINYAESYLVKPLLDIITKKEK